MLQAQNSLSVLPFRYPIPPQCLLQYAEIFYLSHVIFVVAGDQMMTDGLSMDHTPWARFVLQLLMYK